VQDLHYTYDPAGNITRIQDDALRTVIHNGQIVEPVCRYTYDALYRLVEATGREHIGQAAYAFTPPDGNYRDFPFVGAGQLNDLQAVRNYTEQYVYDPAGNFERMIHQAASGNWTRAYSYNENSLIEIPRKSNRLSSTTLQPNGNPPVEPYAHDAHGNMTQMPHLPQMHWDFRDQLSASARQVVNNATPETTYYVYDASGQRVRKVTETQTGASKNERFYLGGFEIYREYRNGAVNLVRETLHVMDDKQRIALIETKTVENDKAINTPALSQRYQFGNHLGSASLELDEAGGLVSYEEYSPYGSAAYQAGRSAAEVSLKRYRYTGKERDEETGFSYHGARYYAAWLGRWTSCDPAGITAGVNAYLYASGSPICLVDSDGMQSGPPHPEDTDIHQVWPNEHEPGTPDAKPAGSEKPTFGSINGVEAPELGGEIRANPPDQANSEAMDPKNEQTQSPQVGDNQPRKGKEAPHHGPSPDSQIGSAPAAAPALPSAASGAQKTTTSGEPAPRVSVMQRLLKDVAAAPAQIGRFLNQRTKAEPPWKAWTTSAPAKWISNAILLFSKKDKDEKKEEERKTNAMKATMWIFFGVFVALAALLIFATKSATSVTYFAQFLKGSFSGLEIILLGVFGKKDLIDKLDPKSKIDKTGADRWSIVHGLAGVVLGLFGVAFPVVLGITVLWEVFEMTVHGFGDTEINANRINDILFALGGWFFSRAILH
jgi:RHS repeat-associated protein